MELSKENLKNYLIDVIGYSEDDLSGMTKEELLDLIDDMAECIAYSKGGNNA